MKKNQFILRGGFFIFLFFFNTIVNGQTAHKLLRKGDNSYLNNDYKLAEENYTKAQQVQRSAKGDYNLGNAIYQQQRYDDAIKQYDDIIAKTKDSKLKFNSLYNKGNAHFWKKEYDKAIDAYKNSLRLNPNDSDAKKNLALAQRMLQQQQQQQNKDQQNQNKDKQNNDKNNQNQNNKDQQNQNKDQQNKNQKQQQQNQSQNQAQQSPQQEMQKEQAKEVLKIMDEEERKVQQRLRKGKPQPSRSTKDW
ncbi:MAG: tetratricopeptide repeat protein [Saprospiraceae bacterium]|nr:tetratricopeptide repeat protein [Saprospiraceae bacterium]